MPRFNQLIVTLLLAVAAAAPALGRGDAVVASIPDALHPWPKCAVSFVRPDTGYSSRRLVRVPVAIRPQQKRTGLKVASHGGRALMLFAWDEPGLYPFWMKGVSLPLSIAFIRSDGRVVGIQRMEPHTTTYHRPSVPVVAALEVPTPLFATIEVEAGMVLHIANCNVPSLAQFSQ